MVDAQRALLDELMGTARNLTEEEKKGYRELQWDDRQVCKCYLVRFCPHDLFTNTKSDLGRRAVVELDMLHSHIKHDLGDLTPGTLPPRSSRHDMVVPRFEAELAQFCEQLIADLDRKVRRGRERLAQDLEAALPKPVSTEKQAQLAAIEEKIRKLLEQIEKLGEDGKVDEAQALMRKVDILNSEKSTVLVLASSEHRVLLSQEKKMALCEVCGSFLVAGDSAERATSHMTGKQHVGFGMVRDFLKEFKEKKDKLREEQAKLKEGKEEDGSAKDDTDEKRRGEREDTRDRGRSRDRDAERERERDKGGSGGGRERDRDDWPGTKERDRDRGFVRGGMRDWGGRGGGVMSGDRDRDRERDRDRDRDRGDRDRDRERSRSREWDRGRDRSYGRERDGMRMSKSSRSRSRSRSPLNTRIHNSSRNSRRHSSRSPIHR
ncbi:hypothetical protein CBR_g19666 [Chara braunii]|uniref:Luc7-like protein 3 n=1 Tax=Chara braunii TaxID=69332 RepID=A0A388KYX9_CHABU|nr:hypothetical protein CBR_g19666 [Chara braunii]|eukprot:GBG75153.1 hypothetical protein CBR_g19666 [Chara braunii]